MKLSAIYEHLKGRQLATLLTALAVIFVVFSGNTVSAQDKTVVTVHDGAVERSFVTEASNVADALERADINISENDLVEPGLHEEITGDSFSVNIYRSHMVTVVDGDETYIVSTAYRSPEGIAEAAGLKVYPEDEFEFVRVDDFINAKSVGMRLIIHRATRVNLSLYGSNISVRTRTADVASFLEEKGVILSGTEVVDPGLDSAIVEGMQVAVSRVGTKVIAENEVVTYGREVINDPNAPIGTQRVKTPGVNGEALVTYEVTYHDGVEVSRTQLQSVTLVEPKDEVVIIGVQALDITGDKLDWMRKAGIAESDWPYVDSIIHHESTWNFTAWNTLGSGAYGLCQALPAEKMASFGDDYMSNPVTQLKWCDHYANERYGSWAQAFDFWENNYWW